MSSRLIIPVALSALLITIAVPAISEAGSGSRSGGNSGYSNPGSATRSGSGNKSGSGTRSPLANALMRYEGKLKKGDAENNQQTMEGFFRINDGNIFAAANPNGAGSGTRAALGGQPTFTLVGSSTKSSGIASASTPIGEYRVSRSGRLTLLFGIEPKSRSRSRGRASSRNKEEGSDNRNKEEGSDKRTAAETTTASDTEPAPAGPPRGVMVLAPKRSRSGDYYSGSFREQDEKGKTIRTWQIRVETVPDSRRSA